MTEELVILLGFIAAFCGLLVLVALAMGEEW